MGYSVKILKDSVAPSEKRLTTWELTYPRMVHAELMTHRLFSRNSASSRAIPNEKLRQRIKDDPAMPVWWGKNQAGMQAREELRDMSPDEIEARGGAGMIPYNERQALTAAKEQWLRCCDIMLNGSQHLADIGLHKQISNRLVEPWMFITVIVSATEFDNWFHLRNHKDAQPEIAFIAKEMWHQYQEAIPQELAAGEWHLPLISEEDRADALEAMKVIYRDAPTLLHQNTVELLKKVSTGRVARVSYLTHEGKRDLIEDVKLHDRLIAGIPTGEPIHMSPFEHIAQALTTQQWNSLAKNEVMRAMEEGRPFNQSIFGNFTGWKQYRKEFPQEHFRR